MKYAIYDKAANGYLTKMEFEVGYSEHTQFECGYNEYITEAQLLDTPKEAADAIVRIKSFKFMEKGRFVMHSFDDTLKDQYIISEAGTPTKVVDNITVDLDGNINVKYGTMVSHWSTAFLEYAINRMNALQKAASTIYTPWCNTFDIYKVITVTDERSCTHYQFIKVTEKGLAKYAKDEEVVSFNKRIEELEKANYDLGERKLLVEGVANRLQEENDNLKTKVEAIKKEAHNWKTLYENAKRDRDVLTNVIDNIYDDLSSTDICKDLKETYAYVKSLSELNYIKIHNDDTADGKPIYISAAAEFKYIINQIITIMESLELNQSVAFSAAEDVKITKDIAEKIISICEADDRFEITLKKFSELYETINIPCADDDTIAHAFKGLLLIFSTMDRKLEDFADELVSWKNKAQKAEKALDYQKRLNDTHKATIAQMVVEKRAMNKELSDAADALKEVNDKNDALADMLREITNYVADIMLATRTVDRDTMISELVGISNKIGFKTSDDGPMFGVLVILNTIINIAKEGTDWKRRAEEVLEERDKAMDYCINDVNLTIEIDKLTSIRNSLAEVIYAIRNAIYNNNSDAFRCINNRMIHDADFNSSSFMAGVRENILDICNACEKNIANNDLKNSEIARLTDERDKALERAEFYKRQANSLYGMIIPCRCNGKQGLRDMLYEVKTGMKVLVDKEKYDSLVECVNNINVTYEILKCTDLTMDKPLWFDGVITRIKTLTK